MSNKIYQMRLLDGSEYQDQWIEVTEDEFNTPLMNPAEWDKRILYTEPPKINPTRQQLRDLVDLVWNEATESTAVPSTAFADKLIDHIFDKTLDSKIPHGENFVSLLTGDLDDKIG